MRRRSSGTRDAGSREMHRFTHKQPLILVTVYFLLVCTLFLGRPGFSSEEAYTALTVEDYLLGFSGQPVEGVGRVWLPPNLNTLEGSTLPAVLAVFMGIFGGSVFVFRFVHVLFSLGTLLCVHGVLRRWFGARAAMISVVLLAVNTTFIRATRFGDQRDEVLQIFLFWLGLWLFQRFAARGLVRYLYAGAFVWGVALNAKIMAVGYFAGVAVASPFLAVAAWRALREARWWRTLVPTALAFALGSAPYIHARVLDFGETSRIATDTLMGESVAWSNTAFLANTGQSLGFVLDLLRGQMGADLLWTRFNPYHPFLVMLAVVGLIALYPRWRRKGWGCRLMFLAVCYTVLLATTNLHPSRSADPYYVIMLLPLAEVVVGVFVSALIDAVPRRGLAVALAVALVAPTVVAEVVVGADYLHQIRTGRITGEYDPVVYEVFEELQRQDPAEVYSFTQFLGYNLYYLGDRRFQLPVSAQWPKRVAGDKWAGDAWVGSEGQIQQSAAFLHRFEHTPPGERGRIRILVQRSHDPDADGRWQGEFSSFTAQLVERGYRPEIGRTFDNPWSPISYGLYTLVER